MLMFSAGVMATSGDNWAVDTSVAVAALDASHAAHTVCKDVVRARRPALAGHAAFETYAVLTRMPGLLSIDGPTAAEVIRRVFPSTAWLATQRASELIGRLGSMGVTGGSVYDALVGEAAASNELRLLTRDLRARRTYELLGVDFELVGV